MAPSRCVGGGYFPLVDDVRVQVPAADSGLLWRNWQRAYVTSTDFELWTHNAVVRSAPPGAMATDTLELTGDGQR